MVMFTSIGTTLERAEPVAPGKSPKNYIFFGRDRDRISEPNFLSTAAIVGAQLKYTWHELEPERDLFALSAIQDDLEFLEEHGKQLFIQIQDMSFDEDIVNVPGYLLEDPVFGGGVAMKYESASVKGDPPLMDGWTARRWDPAVRDRFSRLLHAVAEAFDGRLAGVNLAETSIGFGRDPRHQPPGYTPETYFEGIKDLMSTAGKAFRKSNVIIYANFMPGEELPNNDQGYLKGVYEHARRAGVGVGGPDLRPFRWYQRQHSLPLIAHREPGVVAGVAVQHGNLQDRNRKTGDQITVPELYEFADTNSSWTISFGGFQSPLFPGIFCPSCMNWGVVITEPCNSSNWMHPRPIHITGTRSNISNWPFRMPIKIR